MQTHRPTTGTTASRLIAKYLELTHESQMLAMGKAWHYAAAPSHGCSTVLADAFASSNRDDLAAVQAHYTKNRSELSHVLPGDHDETEPLAAQFSEMQIERRDWSLYLSQAAAREPVEVRRERVLPARAMRRSFEALAHTRAQRCARWCDADRDARVAQHMDRLNWPQYEPVIVMKEDRPVACGALLQAGDVGLICDVFVAESHRRCGHGRQVVDALLRMASRWAIPRVFALVPCDDPAAVGFAGGVSFQPATTISVLRRAGAVEPWA